MELDQLRLSSGERSALETQGFISQEYRGQQRYFKLRFRLKGRQHVRYIGTSHEKAQRIQEELEQIRKRHMLLQEIGRMFREGRALLRQTKKQVEVALENSDFHFHGYEIRKGRKRTKSEVGG